VVLLLIDGGLALVGPILTKRVIDNAIPARDTRLILISVTIFGVALLAQLACRYAETMLTTTLGQRIMHDLRTQIHAHLQRLPISFFDRNPVGRLVTRVTTDVESLNELFTAGVVAGLGDLFTLGAISLLMLLIDWRLALAAFFVIPLVLLASNLFRVHVREAYRAIRTRVARISAYLQERLSGVRIVQLFGREPDEALRFDRLNRDHLDAHLRSITIYALYFPVIELLTTVAFAGLIVVGAQRVGLGVVTVGTVAAFLQLVRRFFDPLQDLSDKYNILQQAMASSERIFKLLDEPGTGRDDERRALQRRNERVIAASTPSDRATTVALRPTLSGPVTVEFQHVWFAYDVAHLAPGEAAPVDREWVLKDVSFVASPDRTLALVGQTGAGKSTIVALLLGFYEPQKGRILIGGIDARQLPVEEIRRVIGYVQQDIFLFAGDVASNIRLTSSLTDAEVRAAADRIGVHRIIEGLPGGYSYRLGERGSALSVGERQLLSFARAIAANPAVLILD
jgi:ATP-binding cassette subfamily B protein